MQAMVDAEMAIFRRRWFTTVTTFVGLVPIMLERSTDAQFLKPAVIALAFGVLFALFVTLVLVPSLYVIGEDMRRGLMNLSNIVRGWFGAPKNTVSDH